MSPSDTDVNAFDAFFYRTHHDDLAGFSARQARRHYQRHGRREGRPPNPASLLQALQAQEGALPPDFDGGDYLALNGDLRQQVRHPWQAAEHYLKHGRHHGRRHRPTEPDRFTVRSSTEGLRRRLVQAFGETTVTETLLLEVSKALHSLTGSASAVTPLLDAVLVCRWLMTFPGAATTDLASLKVQLQLLFRVAFEAHPILPRSAVEVEVINHVRAQAVATELFDAGPARPPVTLLMLAVEAAHGEAVLGPLDRSAAAGLVARFFAYYVPRHALERFVTPEQRALLRAPAGPGDSYPLAAVVLKEVGMAPTGPGLDDRPFLDHAVWLSDMAYVLSSEQLHASQIQVVTTGHQVQLSAPSFLFQDHLGVTDAASWAARESAKAWLERFVWRERQDRGLPQTLVGPSASTYASGAVLPERQVEIAPDTGRVGCRIVRPGDLVTFGMDGAGVRHLVGRGWHDPEAAHVWSSASTALIAINFGEDTGPLDIFIRLSPGPRREPQVTAWWNGLAVAALRPSWNRVFTLHGHLGSSHHVGRRPNLLCLGVEDTFQVEGDGRRLGVALYDLVLVRR